jgi:hypothetical protein
MYAKNQTTSSTVPNSALSIPQKKALLNDPLTTFSYAFEARYGEGSRNMYRMMRHAQDLGATEEEVVQLLDDCNDYWENPLFDDRLEKLKKQGRRLF